MRKARQAGGGGREGGLGTPCCTAQRRGPRLSGPERGSTTLVCDPGLTRVDIPLERRPSLPGRRHSLHPRHRGSALPWGRPTAPCEPPGTRPPQDPAGGWGRISLGAEGVQECEERQPQRGLGLGLMALVEVKRGTGGR